jgi:hypothetical protein
VLVKGTAYSKKTGAMSQHVISVGNTDYAQAKANDYTRNFLLNEMSDNSDESLVESARLVKPVMWATEPAKVGITSAVDITKILWHEEFDDTKTIDGKKFLLIESDDITRIVHIDRVRLLRVNNVHEIESGTAACRTGWASHPD